jgi:hypothetical protein
MKCEFIKRDGEPCQANAMPGSKFCFWHNPENAAKSAAARKKGGQNRRTAKADSHGPYRIETVDDIKLSLNDALNDVYLLENSHARARSIGYLCQILIRAFEVSELEKRLEALENTVGQMRHESR